MRTTSVTIMVIFSTASFGNYLITGMFKFFSQQLRGTLKTAFDRHLTVENFTDMDHHTCLFFFHFIFKQKSTKVPGKLSFTQESEPAPQRALL